MNRTENFIAMAALAIACDVNNPTGWVTAAYIAVIAVFFVLWFSQVRNDATCLDR